MIGSPNYPQINSNWNPLAVLPCSTCCIPCVYGCTDSGAFGYDPLATCDDGTCQQITFGCPDPDAFNYNSQANMPDNSCLYMGCTDPLASNYSFTGSNPAVLQTGDAYEQGTVFDDGSCAYVNSGCTDSLATNYDATAQVDDGSCQYALPACQDLAGHLTDWFEQTADLTANTTEFQLPMPNWLFNMTNPMQWTLSISASSVPYSAWHSATVQQGPNPYDTTVVFSKPLGQAFYTLQIIFLDPNTGDVCDISIKFQFQNGNIPGPITVTVN